MKRQRKHHAVQEVVLRALLEFYFKIPGLLFINKENCVYDFFFTITQLHDHNLCRYKNKNENTTMTNTLKRSVRSVRLCFWLRTFVTYSWMAVCIIVGSSGISSCSPSSSLLHSYINNGNIDFRWQLCTTWTSFGG